jgi:hypothetical protein
MVLFEIHVGPTLGNDLTAIPRHVAHGLHGLRAYARSRSQSENTANRSQDSECVGYSTPKERDYSRETRVVTMIRSSACRFSCRPLPDLVYFSFAEFVVYLFRQRRSKLWILGEGAFLIC